MNEMWQLWGGVLDDPTIHNIITECEYYKPQDANLGVDGNSENENHRISEVRWIDRNDPNSKFIAEILWYYASQANRNTFGFDIATLDEIQYTTYYGKNQGKYEWHHDTFWANPTAYDRKLSVIVQLSDSNDYTGGDFEIDHQYVQPNMREKGTVFVFPSFLLHRVTPVTKGVRKSLVAWIEGPKFR